MTTNRNSAAAEALDLALEEFDYELPWPESTKESTNNTEDNTEVVNNDNNTIHVIDTVNNNNDDGDSNDMDTMFPTPVSVTTTTRTVVDDIPHDYDNNNNPIQLPSKKTTLPRDHARVPLCLPWTNLTERFLLHHVRKMVVRLATHAASYPIAYIGIMTVVSLAVLLTGFFTSFQLIVDSDQIFTPMNSLATRHADWLQQASGFAQVRPLLLILHADGTNVLDANFIQHVFDAVDVVRHTPGYNELCAQGSFVDANEAPTCYIMSATRFWDHNQSLFQQEIIDRSYDTDVTNERLIDVLSQDTYSDGLTPVFHEAILGHPQRSNVTVVYNATTDTLETITRSTNRLHFAESYVVRIQLPNTGVEADAFERQVLENLNALKQSWEQQDTNRDDDAQQQGHVTLDFMSMYAYKIENQRAIIKDVPLVLGIFLVLLVFTTLVYHKRRDPVHSRSMIGMASLVSIGLSLCFAYGWVWLAGIPFTNMAQILPFMIMGVGLDDAFIITGAYFRTPLHDHVVKRIETTMQEVGLSITLTTTTTMLAFLLGFFSAIPGVRWLCIYAFAGIFCVYFYQLTVFIALLVLDERRLQANRRDCCIWRVVTTLPTSKSSDQYSDEDRQEGGIAIPASQSHVTQATTTIQSTRHFSERFMEAYADVLMKPVVKVLVLVSFAAFFGVCAWRVTLLTQEFNVEDFVPQDSFLRGALDALDSHYSLTKPIEVYFRGDDVDQSDPQVQQEMRDYITALADMPEIKQEPPFCWVRDFPKLSDQFPQFSFISDLPFNDQLEIALANPTIREIYGQDIVRDENGNITASRCLIFLRELDLGIVEDQMDFLLEQRAVTSAQPMNVGREDWAFFSFDSIYFYWELYLQSVTELVGTLISGVAAVTIVGFIMMPHWSAALICLPNIICIYTNFLGTMQLVGFHINSLTYIIVVMSVGLLVDFLMHILLRYYETKAATREDKVRETLRTMGASMLISGTTTFLGVCPLVFSTTHIFMTVFWSFLIIVLLGIAHGLVLLPVILSLVGPLSTHIPKKISDDYLAEMTDPSSSDEEEARQSKPKHRYNEKLIVDPTPGFKEASSMDDLEDTWQLPNFFANPEKIEIVNEQVEAIMDLRLDAENSDVSSLLGLNALASDKEPTAGLEASAAADDVAVASSAARAQPSSTTNEPVEGPSPFTRQPTDYNLEYIELEFDSTPLQTPANNDGPRVSYGQDLQSPANTIHPAPSDELEDRYKKRRRKTKMWSF